ncbi:hypothetical protein P886_3331 [Alteromonadaceae bacterium 2753L.S.0a.02]|nr:hypothetical protein P886_3331 [Alteromonadaceae bacterium 2753L.S.0a.02]
MIYQAHIFGSDSKLKRPNFRYAPTVSLDFGECLLKFKNPDHTAMYPINVFPESFNIYDEKHYERQATGDYANKFYERGWRLFGKGNKSRGGIGVTGRIFYFPDEYKEGIDFYDKSCFTNILLFICHESWGFQNKGASLGSLGEGSYKYPIKQADFSVTTINDNTWFRFSAGIDGRPPEIGFATHLSPKHMLYFEFTLEAYRGLDFYSPETNMKEAAFGVVDEFMSHVEISRNGTA